MFESTGLSALLEAGVDGDVTPSAVVRALSSIRPGPALAQWLDVLPIECLAEADLILVGAALERVRRYHAAVENQVLARLDGLPVAIPDHVRPESSFLGGTAPEEFSSLVQSSRADAYAAAAGLSTVMAGHRVRQAAALADSGPLRATGAELASGRLGESKARLIADRLGDLDASVAVAIESAVLCAAEQMTRRRLGGELDRRLAALNPAGEEIAYERARALRCIERPKPLPDGMAVLAVTGPAEDVHLLWTAVEALGAQHKGQALEARRARLARSRGRASAAAGCAPAGSDQATRPPVHPDHPAVSPAVSGPGGLSDVPSFDVADVPAVESIDAYRFDALIGLAAAGLSDDQLPRRHGRRPSIQVTVALSTLLDLDDEPGELEGYGPIAAETARRIASDPSGTLRKLILRDDGLVIHASSEAYRPPQNLVDTLIARDRTCTFPGCSRPSYDCELDHAAPWPGGSTSYWNMHGPCKRHHRAKTAGLWTPWLNPETGDVIWTDPYGNKVIRLAERRTSTRTTLLRHHALETHQLIARLESLSPRELDSPDTEGGPPRSLLLRWARTQLAQLGVACVPMPASTLPSTALPSIALPSTALPSTSLGAASAGRVVDAEPPY